MKVLILTNSKHLEFVKENYLKFHDKHSFYVWAHGEMFTWGERYDIGISFMYQYRVPKEQLTKPWFNFHPAPLPEYRGRNLCYHAIMNGETEFGASLHYMDENFDTGDIIDVARFGIEEWNTAGDVSEMTIIGSESLFIKYLPRIIAGEEFTRYKNEGGNYYPKENIHDFVYLPESAETKIRAVTCGDFYAKTNINGVIYKIVRDE